MPVYVLDATAMIAYLRAESGGETVRIVVEDASSFCVAHALNLCEVYYDYLRAYSTVEALKACNSIINDGVIVREDMDSNFWQDIGNLKVNPGKLSLADCCGLALARRENATFLSADHHELDRILATNTVNIQFIR